MNIQLAILHGSRATGNTHANSDWDVAVLGNRKLDIKDKLALMDRFGEQLGIPAEKIDIADLNSDSPLLRYRVAMEGKILEGNMLDFRKFQIRAWKDYLNNQKMFDLRSKFLNKAFHG